MSAYISIEIDLNSAFVDFERTLRIVFHLRSLQSAPSNNSAFFLIFLKNYGYILVKILIFL